MSEIVFRPFGEQERFLHSRARIKGAFAGKRGGKTEVGAIETIICAEEKRGYKPSEVDPCIGIILSPTNDMLHRLTLQKLFGYGSGFVKDFHETKKIITWHNGTLIYAISADKPERIEGIKASFAWLDESFQMSEQLFLEVMARLSDSQGYMWCTGSLGTQYTNPRAHWIYKHFKEKPLEGSEVFEWSTADNPHFPREELLRMQDTLDPRTYRQMFEIDWNVPGTALVYDEFDDANLMRCAYDPKLPLYVSIDWGWTHPMAALFIQYDRANDRVFVIDEIIKSKMKLDHFYNLIMAKPYRITEWICDIAGNQEREQTGISNVEWFKNRGIRFTYRSVGIQPSISIVRSFIRNSKGQARLFVDDSKCPKLVDNIRNYSYPTKNGMITNENPVKENDDAVDALRYYFANKHDALLKPNEVQILKR